MISSPTATVPLHPLFFWSRKRMAVGDYLWTTKNWMLWQLKTKFLFPLLKRYWMSYKDQRYSLSWTCNLDIIKSECCLQMSTKQHSKLTWPLSIQSDAIWVDQCTSNFPLHHEPSITTLPTAVCVAILGWYPHLQQHHGRPYPAFARGSGNSQSKSAILESQ